MAKYRIVKQEQSYGRTFFVERKGLFGWKREGYFMSGDGPVCEHTFKSVEAAKNYVQDENARKTATVIQTLEA